MAKPAVDDLQVDMRDPLALQLCLGLLEEESEWRAAVDEVLRQLDVDPQTAHTTSELREMVGRYIPYEHSLSDVVIAMRDE